MAPARTDEPNKVIYSMVGVGKVHGPRQVLKDISLGYFYGAKIGVIGLNGSGKSTLLRIMAGVDTEHLGRGRLLARLHHRLPRAGAAARPDKDGRSRWCARGGRGGRAAAPSSRRSASASPSRWTTTR